MTKKVRIEHGLAFFVVCDRGFAIGLYTHAHEQMGALVWMADGFLFATAMQDKPRSNVPRIDRYRSSL